MKKLIVFSLMFFSAVCNANNLPITSKAIWQPSQKTINQIIQCHSSNQQYLKCVVRLMKQQGASPDAIHFTRSLNGFGFASEVTMYGKIAFVRTLALAADHSTDYYLVNGSPFIIDINDIKYIGNQASFGDHEKPSVKTLANGNRAFTFTYPIKACHACKTTGSVTKRFLFNKENRLTQVD